MALQQQRSLALTFRVAQMIWNWVEMPLLVQSTKLCLDIIQEQRESFKWDAISIPYSNNCNSTSSIFVTRPKWITANKAV